MKPKLMVILVATILLSLTFTSCLKEPMADNNELQKEFSYDLNGKIPYSSINIMSKGFVGKSGSDKILVFQDMPSFLLTLKELERQMQELDSAFVSFYASLDEEALNAKEKEIGFRQEKPLFDFANFFNYYSLFKKIDEEEKLWLSNEVLDEMNDPDNHFIFDEELRAVLNLDCEVQIGKIIYKFTENGYFEISSGSLKSLTDIDQDPEKYKYLQDVDFIGNTVDNKSDCRGWEIDWDYKVSGSKRIKWKVAILTYPWDRFVKAKTKNYKKSTFLGITYWDLYRTACSARVYGHISGIEGDCSKQVQFNPSNGAYASDSKAKWVTHKIYVVTKSKSSWIKGHHWGAEGIQYSSTLTW